MNADNAPRLVPVKYEYDTTGNITTPSCPPFDGKPVLIKTNIGWVEAWWCAGTRTETLEGVEYEGFCWVCYDDLFQCDLEEALYWMPIPVKDCGDEHR